MHKVLALAVDVVLVVAASAVAVLLRQNFEIPLGDIPIHARLIAVTGVFAAILIPIIGLHRAVWRLSSRADYFRAVLTAFAIVTASVAFLFGLNRLEGIPRSMPILQWILISVALVSARVLFRTLHDRRRVQRFRSPSQESDLVPAAQSQNVLIVGLSYLTEAYLISINELAPSHIRVAGILGAKERHIGRLVASQPVLGTPEQVERIVDDLDIHGVKVSRLVVTVPFANLSQEAQDALLRLDHEGTAQLTLLVDDMVFGSSRVEHVRMPQGADASPGEDRMALRVNLRPTDIVTLSTRPYWTLKRAVDIAVSGGLLLILSPLMIVIGLLVGITMGFPVAFWQQRPGLRGRAFRVYKFRTMGGAYDGEGRRIPDEYRTHPVGAFLRLSRLDELPQLVNILRGDMSFVGPRPLLPRDQSDNFSARLLVRPGLTGWAQINGGRVISAEEKAILDVWYVCNASLWLDLRIMLSTVPMILNGERVLRTEIEKATCDLMENGILRGTLGGMGERDRSAA